MRMQKYKNISCKIQFPAIFFEQKMSSFLFGLDVKKRLPTS